MYIIREIFQLHFGAYKAAKALLDEAKSKSLLPVSDSSRVLSDFTGDSYRLVFEVGYESLAEFERSLGESMNKEEWKKWYEKFKQHIRSSHREIMKQVI